MVDSGARRVLADPWPWAVAGLAAGIVAADRYPEAAPLRALAGVVVAVLVAVAACCVRRRGGFRGGGRLVLLALPLLGGVAIGLLRGAAPMTPIAGPGIVAAHGTVARALLPRVRPTGARGPPAERASFVLDGVTLHGSGPEDVLAVHGAVRIDVDEAWALLPRGARVRVLGALVPPREARNPGEPDGAERRRRSGIAAVIRCEAPANVTLVAEPPPLHPGAWVDRARAAVLAHLDAMLSPPAAGLAAALLLDVRDGIPRAAQAAIAQTGLIHLLAISGVNLAIVVGTLRALLGLVLRAAFADVLAIAGTVAFAALAGAGPPVVRAAVAALLVLACRLLRRRPQVLAPLCAGAIVILVHDPADLFRAGFQLSFVAVAGLATLERPAAPENRTDKGGSFAQRAASRLRESIGEGLRMSVRATLFTLPLTLIHFGQAPLLAPFLTVAVTPLFLATFACTLVHGLPGMVLPAAAGHALAIPAEWLDRAMLAVFQLAREIPGATLPLPRPGLAGCAGLIAAYVPLLLGRGSTGRVAPASAAALLAGAGLVLDAAARAPPDRLEVVLFDVGHGQAALVRAPDGFTALLDAGSRGAPDVGTRTLLPALDALGVAALDLLVLSHADADHVNGAKDLVDAGRVRSIAAGFAREADAPATLRALFESVASAHVPWRRARQGDVLARRDAGAPFAITVLWPPDDAPVRSDNDRSLVLAVTYGDALVLCPGDVQSAAIRRLAARDTVSDGAMPGGARVLVLPHHGNREPLLGLLLHGWRPGVAVASRGGGREDPAAERGVVAMLHRAEIPLRCTAHGGAITVRASAGGTVSIVPFLPPPDRRDGDASPDAAE